MRRPSPPGARSRHRPGPPEQVGQPEPIRKASPEVTRPSDMSSPTRRLTDHLHQTFDTFLEDAPALLLSMVAPVSTQSPSVCRDSTFSRPPRKRPRVGSRHEGGPMGSEWGLAPLRIGRDNSRSLGDPLVRRRPDLGQRTPGSTEIGFVRQRRPVMVWTTRGSSWQSRTSSPSARRRRPRPHASPPS